MNPLIKAQLDKLKSQKRYSFDDSSLKIELKRKITFDVSDIKEDQCYLIEVEDYILNPPEGFTLHTNWNNNIIPKHKFMKVDVNKIMGKMVKVTSIGYDVDKHQDINEMWVGWLPQKAITIIERL